MVAAHISFWVRSGLGLVDARLEAARCKNVVDLVVNQAIRRMPHRYPSELVGVQGVCKCQLMTARKHDPN